MSVTQPSRNQPDRKPDPRKQRSNRLVAGMCLAFFGGMVGMAYAAVPLYAMFCQMTGYGGTTQRVEQYSDRVLDREITVRFDANVSSGLPWDFKPVQRNMTMKIGETAEAHYTATNLFDTPTAGRATFNVTPEIAGSYFNKVECFCFTDTTLKPGETLDMPVVFYVDPDIADVPELKDITTITLSYTFFPIEEERPVAAAPQAKAGPIRTNTEENLGG
jgi:cytochrome c oxidase assembly protein subunit 11